MGAKRKIKNFAVIIIVLILSISIWLFANKIIKKSDKSLVDLTSSKLFSISDKSKEKIKEIDHNIIIRLVNYSEKDIEYILAKQYSDINEKIQVFLIKGNENPEIIRQLNISSNQKVIWIEGMDNRIKLILESDTYYYEDGKTYSIIEQKITNAILDISVKYTPVVYFTKGNNEFEFSKQFLRFKIFVENNINEVKDIDLDKEEFPKDCDLLVIANPTEDFSEIKKNKIIDYINNGGNIMWMQNPYILNTNGVNSVEKLKNIQEIFRIYGLKFGDGLVCTMEEDFVIGNNPSMFASIVNYSDITKNIYDNGRLCFFGSTKIENENDETLEKLKVTPKILARSNSNSYYKKNLDIAVTDSNDEKGSFILAQISEKELENGKKSKFLAISTANIVTNVSIPIDNQRILPSFLEYNREFALNSVRYLTNRNDLVEVLKLSGIVSFREPTQIENIIVISLIIIMPVIFIVIGFIIQIKRRKG